MKKRGLLWEDKYRITTYHTGPNSKASLTSLCNFFQETAWQHANYSKLGYYDLKEKGYMWILSRLRVVIYRYPDWNEEIKVLTWPKSAERLFAYRDFEIRSKNDSVLACATSGWLILDVKTRRPQRMSNFLGKMEFLESQNALEDSLKKLSVDVEERKESFLIQYSHLDLNNHVNNVKYIEWILNGHPPEILSNFQVSDFRIDFLGELKLGDVVNLNISSPLKEENKKTFNAILKNDNGNNDVCKAKVKWDTQKSVQ
jgi:medium-chain acyl-[acyl-carrier-protein] hydrolase